MTDRTRTAKCLVRIVPVLATVFCIPLSLPSVVAQDRTEEIGSDETRSAVAASYVQALLANNRSILAYDVLVKRETFVSSPTGEIRDIKVSSRYVHRRDGEMHLYLSAQHSGTWNEQTSDVKPHFALTGLAFDEMALATRSIRGIRSRASPGLERCRRLCSWPNFLTLGLTNYPDLSSPLAEASPFWERATVPNEHISAGEVDSDHVRVVFTPPNDVGAKIRYRWIFDSHTFTPTALYIDGLFVGEKNWRLVERTSFQWEEVNGVFVPKSIHRSVIRGHFQDDTGKRVDYEEYDDAVFEWFSVNELLNDNRFGEQALRSIDAKSFLKLDIDSSPEVREP